MKTEPLYMGRSMNNFSLMTFFQSNILEEFQFDHNLVVLQRGTKGRKGGQNGVLRMSELLRIRGLDSPSDAQDLGVPGRPNQESD